MLLEEKENTRVRSFFLLDKHIYLSQLGIIDYISSREQLKKIVT